MKILFIILLFCTSYTYSGKVLELKRKKVEINSVSIESVSKMFDELKPLLDAPMGWCDLEFTDRFNIEKVDKKTSTLEVEVSLECDETKSIKLFRNIITKYSDVINKYPDLVDAEMRNCFPHLVMKWYPGDIRAVAIVKYNSDYTNINGYAQRLVFFKIVMDNGIELPKLNVFKIHGSILDTEGNALKSGKFIEKNWFSQTILNTTINGSAPKLKFKRVFRIEKEML